jgi:acetyl-CoA synthetase
MLGSEELRDRLDRGQVRHVIAGAAHASKFTSLGGKYTRISAGGHIPDWCCLEDAFQQSASFVPDGPTHSRDPLLLYFTSGTTSKPKLVEHSHQSYGVGQLSTMYWLGLQPGDVHWNISSPGWGNHAWSSFFAPWNAGATVFAYHYSRFNTKEVLGILGRD